MPNWKRRKSRRWNLKKTKSTCLKISKSCVIVIVCIFRAAEKEIAVLCHMSEQMKPRLTETVAEAVDLDNLFAFLSDVQPHSGNKIIEEIGEKMDELVEDLDVELETVIQQELEGLAQEQSQQPTPPKMGLPSLPEPTGPPPPPPPVAAVESSAPAPIVVPEDIVNDNSTNEPIYEAVLPRDDSTCVSPPPLPAPPRIPSDSPHQSPPVSRSGTAAVRISTVIFRRQNR